MPEQNRFRKVSSCYEAGSNDGPMTGTDSKCMIYFSPYATSGSACTLSQQGTKVTRLSIL